METADDKPICGATVGSPTQGPIALEQRISQLRAKVANQQADIERLAAAHRQNTVKFNRLRVHVEVINCSPSWILGSLRDDGSEDS